MSSRAFATVRAALPLTLVLALVGCSALYCGDEAFRRELDLRYGEIAGTAFVPGPEREPAAFVQANVRGTPFVRRTDSEGRFLFSGLAEGAWMVTVSEDSDGDGKPERRRVISTVLRQESHRTSTSYVPFVGGSSQSALTGVDVGEVVLEGTVRVEGRVLVDGPGGPVPPVERGQVAVVLAGRNLGLPRVEDPEQTDLVSLGAEVKTGVDDQGKFVLRNVSGGAFYLLVLVYDEAAAPGQPGALLEVSAPLEIRSEGKDVVAVEADIVLPGEPSTPRVPAQFVVSPAPTASEQMYLILVPPGMAMPSCEFPPKDYAGTPLAHALTTATVAASATPQLNDVPVGVWDIQACFTGSPAGTLFAQTVTAKTDEDPAVLLGPILLTDLPQCKPSRPCDEDADCGDGFTCSASTGRCTAPTDWIDCDGDGLRGLPTITNDDERAIWASCVSACFAGEGTSAADSTCQASDGNTYDCDDDGDGQPDVTEAQECYGVGKGTDSDGDGICDGIDPFPECRANTAAACEAGAPPDPPSVPEAYASQGSGDVDAGEVGADECPATRMSDTSDWCSASAEGGDICPVWTMTCGLEPVSESRPQALCNALTGLGCPAGTQCLFDQAVGGVAPCLDPSEDALCEGTVGSCPIEGFSCQEVEDSIFLCVSALPSEPDFYATSTCECCAGDGCRTTTTTERVWTAGGCTDAELEQRWDRCHSGAPSVDNSDAGTRVDVCGDGIPTGNEECDDGNNEAGDGCDPDCRREPSADGGSTDAGSIDPGGTECQPVTLEDLLDGGITLPCIEASGGGPLVMTGAISEGLDLAGVEEIRGGLEIRETTLFALFAPDLREITGGGLVVENNSTLSIFEVFQLSRIEGDVSIWRNPQLHVGQALPSGLVVTGEGQISANGCDPIDDECPRFGAQTCTAVDDSSWGTVTVCAECDGLNPTCSAAEFCDSLYDGSAGTGTYTCKTGQAPDPDAGVNP